MKHLLVLVALILACPTVYYSTDFNPSWIYWAFVALVSTALFLRLRIVFIAKKAAATEGLLKTSNASSLSLAVALITGLVLAMPVGKALTFSFGKRSYQTGVPVYASEGRPRGYCQRSMLVRLPDGDEIWVCRAARSGPVSTVRIKLTRSVFGYYSTI